MREIKFRGKRIDNGEWAYGYPIIISHKAWIKDISDKTTNPRILARDFADFRCVKVEKETVGQYTGCDDKRGREIYDGSIVRFYPYGYERIGLVEFLNRGWKVGGFDLMYFGSERIEVIGNIYENPELLEWKKAKEDVRNERANPNGW